MHVKLAYVLCTSERAEVSLLHSWLLAFTKSFASLVSRVFGLLSTRLTSDANDFVNAKSHAGKKNCAQGIFAQLWFTRSRSTRLSCTQRAFFAYNY